MPTTSERLKAVEQELREELRRLGLKCEVVAKASKARLPHESRHIAMTATHLTALVGRYELLLEIREAELREAEPAPY